MFEQLYTSINEITYQTRLNVSDLLLIISIPWFVFLINLFLNQRLLYLGIIPRKIYGLPGIFFAPLLHANFNHLFFNSIPLIVLSNFILMHGFNYFLWVTFLITIICGFLTWCLGKPGIHVGASGVITGYWGLLVSDIYQQGTLTAIILGIVCLYYFAGIFYSIFPREKGVSWEGHLFGLMAGLITSYTSLP